MSAPAGPAAGEPQLASTAGVRRGTPAAALFLLSGSGLLFEIATTRLLSALYFSTFTSLVLSIAVLGLGAGAALASLLPGLRSPARHGLWALLAGLSAAALTLLAIMGAPFELRLLLFPATALPFLFIGLTTAGIFAARSGASTRLYLADLAGAGVFALATVPLLDLLGAPGAMLLAAAGMAAAALAVGPLRPALLGSGVLALLLLAHLGGLTPTLDMGALATPKPLRETLRAGGTLHSTRWDSFARTDLVSQGEDRYLVYLDGGAGSLVPSASRPERWRGDIGALPFAVAPTTSAFLIGSGAGLDVALARAAGTERVVAAELNRATVELTRALGEEAGEVYDAGTQLLVDDGRRALQRVDGAFDLILLSQVVSQAAEARGLALVENGLYTVEAFGEYLERLTPGGRFALKLYDELTLTRAMVTALTALEERGASAAEAARHLFAALDTRTSPPLPLLIVSNAPLRETVAIDWARRAEEQGHALLYVPGLLAPPQLQAILAGEAGTEALVSAAADLDLGATRDDAPYFYSFEAGLPRSLRPLLTGVLALLAVTLTAELLRGGRTASRPERVPGARRAALLFTGLGAGFMLLEITVLNGAQLAIGQPALTLAAVLAALLLGAAGGSGLAGRVTDGREARWLAASAMGAALLFGAWFLAWPALAENFRSLPPGTAALCVALTLLPTAIPLGAPFPLLLRRVGRSGGANVAAGWMVNGAASVAGAVTATALAMTLGFTAAWLAGVVAYLGVALLAGLTARREVAA